MSGAVVQAVAEIGLGPVEDLRPEVRIMPMATMLSLLADVAGRRQGVPEAWRDTLRARLSPESVRVLAPLFGHRGSDIPHCLTPSVSIDDVDFETHLQQIVDAARHRLVAEVEEIYGTAVPRPWRSALCRPGRWIGAYAQVMAVAWSVFQPVWQRAQPLLEREIARVGTATVRGALDLVLSDLNPRWRYRSGRLLIPDVRPGSFPLAQRRLVLTPTVSGVGASIFDPDLVDKVWLGYPVPGLASLSSREPVRSEGDLLAAMIGPVRAALLRHAGSMHSMSGLAELLHCAPSVVTYHCGQLVDAGLLYRERRGRQVRVRRTERGEALLDLIASW